MADYKLNITPPSDTVNSVFRTSDGVCIPFAIGNKDYDDYLKWVEDGNTPAPAD